MNLTWYKENMDFCHRLWVDECKVWTNFVTKGRSRLDLCERERSSGQQVPSPPPSPSPTGILTPFINILKHVSNAYVAYICE